MVLVINNYSFSLMLICLLQNFVMRTGPAAHLLVYLLLDIVWWLVIFWLLGSVKRSTLFLVTPREAHWHAALKVIKYIHGICDQGLFFSSDANLSIIKFCDADWASCPSSRLSLNGYCVMIGDSLVNWKCKKQHIVSRSSAETDHLLIHVVSLPGFFNFILKCISPTSLMLYFVVTTNQYFTLHPIMYFMSYQVHCDWFSLGTS